jgi:two-component system, NarL family, nitrate/nitrite response regulator NarL
MQGLPVKMNAVTKVLVFGNAALLESISSSAHDMLLIPSDENIEASARASQADVIVVDVRANTRNMIELVGDLRVRKPILVIAPENFVEEAIDAGVSGVLLADVSNQQIVAAISAVSSGLKVLQKMLPTRGIATSATDSVLTPRELEVTTLLAEGLSNREIGARLGISDHTAKFHVNSILQKMGAGKRVGAVVRAAQLGLINIS